jgi:hypothetical protein
MGGARFTMAKRPADGADRYVARQTGAAWCVWDTLRDDLVFGAERMNEEQAHALARQLSDAYRRIARYSGLSGRPG